MDIKIIGLVMGFTILISIQYTLNKILRELIEIKEVLKGNGDNTHGRR